MSCRFFDMLNEFVHFLLQFLYRPEVVISRCLHQITGCLIVFFPAFMQTIRSIISPSSRLLFNSVPESDCPRLGSGGDLISRHFRPDGHTPLGQSFRAGESLGDGPERRLRQPDAPLVRPDPFADERADAPPRHRPGPPQHVRHRRQ